MRGILIFGVAVNAFALGLPPHGGFLDVLSALSLLFCALLLLLEGDR